jgi:hypothetical protein
MTTPEFKPKENKSAAISTDLASLSQELGSNIRHIQESFKTTGFASFKANSIPEIEQAYKTAELLDKVNPTPRRGQTRGVEILQDYPFDKHAIELMQIVRDKPLVDCLKMLLSEQDLKSGTVLLNNYRPGEMLERHRDGVYRPDLKGVLLIYLPPTSDTALHLETRDGEKINPRLEAGDCILLHPDIYHWVEPVQSPRRSVLIEFSDPYHDDRIRGFR